jgi:hypothetical protein
VSYEGNVSAFVLLGIGYPVAVIVLTRLKAVLTRRRVRWFAALQAATASIMVGWLLLGRAPAALLNGAALVGFGIAWVATAARPRPPDRGAS